MENPGHKSTHGSADDKQPSSQNSYVRPEVNTIKESDLRELSAQVHAGTPIDP